MIQNAVVPFEGSAFLDFELSINKIRSSRSNSQKKSDVQDIRLKKQRFFSDYCVAKSTMYSSNRSTRCSLKSRAIKIISALGITFVLTLPAIIRAIFGLFS